MGLFEKSIMTISGRLQQGVVNTFFVLVAAIILLKLATDKVTKSCFFLNFGAKKGEICKKWNYVLLIKRLNHKSRKSRKSRTFSLANFRDQKGMVVRETNQPIDTSTNSSSALSL